MKPSRVRVERAVAADGKALVAANRASRAHHLPWAEPFTDQAGFDAWIARGLTGPHVGLVAREDEGGAIIGVVNLNEIVVGAFRSAYLGYYGMADFAGRGLMTEAVQAAMAFAFGPLGLHRLEANIQPGNTASLALVRRLKFRHEGFSPRYLQIGGEWRDHERFAITVEEFPAA